MLKLPTIAPSSTAAGGGGGGGEADAGSGRQSQSRRRQQQSPPQQQQQQQQRPRSSGTKNPFHMPSDVEVFSMREDERRVKQETKEKMRHLHIYEKSVVKRKNFKELLAEEEDDVRFYDELRKRDADKVLTTRQARVDRHFGKENLHDFIAKKREMFLVQYALGVKREEMRKLEEIAQAEEQKLLDDEKALEEDAAKFDAFLKENDKNSVEAIKKYTNTAEQETKAKLEKIQEIKKLNVHIMSIRSDMSKNEDQLKDLQRYREFLDKLTPREWFEDRAREKRKAVCSGVYQEPPSGTKPRPPGKSLRGGLGVGAGRAPPALAAPQPRAGGGGPSVRITLAQNPDDDVSADDPDPTDASDDNADAAAEDDEALLYFKSPQQLLDIFAELEENNLALIQNCQETEETLEELKQRIVDTEARMDQETQSLKHQIDFLNAAIAREEDKAKMLEERAKMFSTGNLGGESQEKLLEELNHKVKEVYRRCIGDNEATLSTLTMLTTIENRLENLFETIEMMPMDKVEQAEKMKDKERRQRLREEKMEAQRLLQEERVQRALERARAPVIKKTGKPIAFRSAPPQKKKRKEEDTKKKEEEDLEYYGLLTLP
ncbi:Coiled-coil domain-containing protein 38 [Geranomyces variabilis]|uniref:Coiled-coil domain-containing protein 38 n=1 Tax=Geranomyces variabilis TaxID=109894 RepID=A0AAD5TQJ3_9FUNG|nr:Coiled-coil domain-containing protein 38 [Geranomyces variabilis]